MARELTDEQWDAVRSLVSPHPDPLRGALVYKPEARALLVYVRELAAGLSKVDAVELATCHGGPWNPYRHYRPLEDGELLVRYQFSNDEIRVKVLPLGRAVLRELED